MSTCWGKAVNQGRQDWRGRSCDPLDMQGKGREIEASVHGLLQSWAWDLGIGLWEMRERQRSSVNLPTSLARVHRNFQDYHCLPSCLSVCLSVYKQSLQSVVLVFQRSWWLRTVDSAPFQVLAWSKFMCYKNRHSWPHRCRVSQTKLGWHLH